MISHFLHSLEIKGGGGGKRPIQIEIIKQHDKDKQTKFIYTCVCVFVFIANTAEVIGWQVKNTLSSTERGNLLTTESSVIQH